MKAIASSRAPSAWELARMKFLHQERGLSLAAIGWLYGRRSAEAVAEILSGGVDIMRKSPRSPSPRAGRAHNTRARGKRVDAGLVAEMHALHLGGMNLSELGERYGRTNATIRDLFLARGLRIVKQPRRPYRKARKKRAGTYRVPHELVAEMHALYLGGLSAVEIGLRYGRTAATIGNLFKARGLQYPIARAYPKVMPKRIAADEITAMYAFYQEGHSLAECGRKFKRSGKQVGHLFRDRGLELRPTGRPPRSGRRADGTFGLYTPATQEVIDAAIAAAPRILIPDHLRLDWRKWSMEQRRDFIERIRAKLASPDDRPELPFSPNVRPFDYTTAEARAIAEAEAAGRIDSRVCPSKIKLSSQGVIWSGRLWFWSAKPGYSHGVWPNRTLLHRAIWEHHHGRELGPNDIIRFMDGNPNNLDPSNLVLCGRDQLAGENQIKRRNRESREQLDLLLKRHANPNSKHHDLIRSLHA